MLKNNYDLLLVAILVIASMIIGVSTKIIHPSTNDSSISVAASEVLDNDDNKNLNYNSSPHDLKNFTTIGYDNSYNIMWICNNYTKVVYVATYETYRSAKPHFINITPLLNADGTPVTYSEETWS